MTARMYVAFMLNRVKRPVIVMSEAKVWGPVPVGGLERDPDNTPLRRGPQQPCASLFQRDNRVGREPHGPFRL